MIIIGVDDYMVKPIDLDELFLRIVALLRRLHRSASQKAESWSIALGVIGSLVLGTGMSLFLTELGEPAMPAGILVGLAGLTLIALAYPVYNRILKKERQRIAPEILRLTEELLK